MVVGIDFSLVEITGNPGMTKQKLNIYRFAISSSGSFF